MPAKQPARHREMRYLERMRNSRISRAFTPGAISERKAFAVGIVVLFGLAFLDYSLGEEFRLHSLYLFPFAYIAIHCTRVLQVVFAAAVTFALQGTVIFFYPIPLNTKIVSTLASLSIVCLTGGLARSLRKTLVTTHHDATHDALTGLQNRRSFDDFLEAEIARQRRYGSHFSLLLVDLDRFKELNDERGHNAGDNALRLAAKALKRSTRDSDIVARFGGDEFAILLPNSSHTDCAAICANIIKNVDAEMTAAGYRVTASIGSRTFDIEPDSASSAIRQADEALYAAKARGRNQFVSV